MNFAVSEMTFLRYFLPLTIEGNQRNIKSKYFFGASNKYNCPFRSTNTIKKLSDKYDFECYNIGDINNHCDLTFLIEGVLNSKISNQHKKISITYMTDFIYSYKDYIDSVDYAIFPSHYIADCYKKISNKNLYLGSPKYDYNKLNRNELLKKYNLPDKKFVLIVFPRSRDLDKINLNVLYEFLKKMKFNIIVKTRGKDYVTDLKLKGDHYYEDFSWYPHDTMDLIELSDFVVNFGSTTIKECVMLKTPIIDFDIKPKGVIRGFNFLYDYDYCKVFDGNVSFDTFSNAVNSIVQVDENLYNDVIDEYLFTGNSSKRILDFCLDL
jgi:hypothetical protein